MPEKEGFAIVGSMTRLDYLVLGRVVSIFTDHANLVYLYDTYGRNPGIARYTASKLMRWALKLIKPKNELQVSAKAATVKALMVAPINIRLDARLDWPTMAEISNSQNISKESPPDGGWRTTKASISSHFYWKQMTVDIEQFVKSCIHCLSTVLGKIVPRPLAHALHASSSNELLHFDFCYIIPGNDNIRYVLILKDDHSGYLWLVPTSKTDAETVSEALIKWFASFKTVQNWVSDRGSHFKNELMRLLNESMKGFHPFTLAYCPWSNGTVEVVCQELLRALRALISELQLPQRCWPSVIPLVQSALNNAIIPRLGIDVLSITEARAKPALQADKLLTALEQMHKDVHNRSSKKRQAERQKGNKAVLKWLGPFRVTACRPHNIFQIENLITSKKEEAHARRLKLFRNKDYKVTEELKNHLAYQPDELFLIDKSNDIRKKNGVHQVLVSWKGFGIEERDWVDIDLLQQNVPNMLNSYFEDIGNNGTPRQRKAVRSI
eukprot:IDg5938t1